MQKLLEELDGAYLVRYVNNHVFVWHGGDYVNIFDSEGNSAGALNFSYCDDVHQLEDELGKHFVDMGYFPEDESGEEAKLLREQPYSPEPGSQGSADGPTVYKVHMLVAVESGQEEYILNSIEDGMQFDEEAGEGIIEYDIQSTGGEEAAQ